MMHILSNYGKLVILLVDHNISRTVVECNDTFKQTDTAIIINFGNNNKLKVPNVSIYRVYNVTEYASAVEVVAEYYK